MERTDAELVLAAAGGDQASFGKLYERHYKLAVGISLARLNDRHLAEDAAQESFVVACRSLVTLRNPQRFAEWLGTICRRTASRFQSRYPVHMALVEESADLKGPKLAALRIELKEALDLLDEITREIVILRYFGGLSYLEISEALGITPQSVHGRLQRSRIKLAKALEVQGIQEEKKNGG